MNTPQQQSKEKKLRTLAIHGRTRQTSLRLDGITWSAIDFLAAREGIRWQDWAARVIDANYQTENMAGELRQAAIQQLLGSVGQGSGNVPLAEFHELLGMSYSRLDDAGLANAMENAFVQHRDESFMSFSIVVGFLGDHDKRPFLCVQNRMRGAQHMLAILEEPVTEVS